MIYFDNASTTAVNKEVADFMYNAIVNDFANPSSLHGLGFGVEKKITEARNTILSVLGVNNGELFFTSGGTEANNTAVMGAAHANARAGKHLITTAIEHPSVAESFQRLEEEGFEVTYLPVNSVGLVSIDDLKNALREDTILVSVMYVNNEVGSIQPVEEMCKAVKEYNKNIVFHTDCVQAFCKHKIPNCVDIITFSSHKIQGPKGVGGIFIKKGVKVKGLHLGGGQEKGFRPGTENTTGIIAFGEAARIAEKNREENYKRVENVKNTLLNALSPLEGVYLNGDKGCSPYILNLSFEGVKGEVLLHALENYEIYVATGSACSAKAQKKLKIVDLLIKGRGENNIRLSFCGDNTVEEAEIAAQKIMEAVPMLRRFKPR